MSSPRFKFPPDTNARAWAVSGQSPTNPTAHAGRSLQDGKARLADLRIAGVVPASHLQRPAAPTVSCGIAEVDTLTGGLPRGALTEICGPASSGRTTLLLSALAEATRRQEICALIDVSDSFDPGSAAAAGIDLERLLWVRCDGEKSPQAQKQNPPQRHRGTEDPTGQIENRKSKIKTASSDQITNHKSSIKNRSVETADPSARPGNTGPYSLGMTTEGVGRGQLATHNSQLATRFWLGRIEQALRATDLVLQGGGFGLIAIDLADVPPELVRRVPLASWFRFRRAVEHTATVLLVIEQQPFAKTCASLVLQTTVPCAASGIVPTVPEGAHPPTHGQLFRGVNVQVEIVRARLDTTKKPAASVCARFATANEWTGTIG